MNVESLSPNLQSAVKIFSKLSHEEVISSLKDEKFVESLSITAEELNAIHVYLDSYGKDANRNNVQEYWL